MFLNKVPHCKPFNPPCPVCGSHGRNSKCVTYFPSGNTCCHGEKDVSWEPGARNSGEKWRIGKIDWFTTFIPLEDFINPAIAHLLEGLTPDERRAIALGAGASLSPQKPLGPAITADEIKNQEEANKQAAFTVRYTVHNFRPFTDKELFQQSLWLWSAMPSRDDIDALLDVRIVAEHDFDKCGEKWWTAIPESDGAGNVTGYSLREFAKTPHPDYGKKSATGSIRGITVLKNFDPTKPVWIFEGFTSTLTAGLCGINALGVPGVGNGLRFLLGLLPDKNIPVIIPIENDQKPDGYWPGMRAKDLAKSLIDVGYTDVKMCFYPDDAKDIRAFVKGEFERRLSRKADDEAEVAESPKITFEELGAVVMDQPLLLVDAIACEVNLEKKNRKPMDRIDVFGDSPAPIGGDGAALKPGEFVTPYVADQAAENRIANYFSAGTEPAIPPPSRNRYHCPNCTSLYFELTSGNDCIGNFRCKRRDCEVCWRMQRDEYAETFRRIAGAYTFALTKLPGPCTLAPAFHVYTVKVSDKEELLQALRNEPRSPLIHPDDDKKILHARLSEKLRHRTRTLQAFEKEFRKELKEKELHADLHEQRRRMKVEIAAIRRALSKLDIAHWYIAIRPETNEDVLYVITSTRIDTVLAERKDFDQAGITEFATGAIKKISSLPFSFTHSQNVELADFSFKSNLEVEKNHGRITSDREKQLNVLAYSEAKIFSQLTSKNGNDYIVFKRPKNVDALLLNLKAGEVVVANDWRPESDGFGRAEEMEPVGVGAGAAGSGIDIALW